MAASVAEAQARLTESEAELRLLADNSADVIIKLDPKFRRIYTSPSVRDILGYEPAELTGAQPVVLLHPEDHDRVQALFRSLVTETDRVIDVHRLRHRDGRWVWFEANLRRVDDRSTGEVRCILGALRDTSRRKALEDELSRANDRLQAWALQDGLTGLANRRSFDDILDRECRRAARDGLPLGLIMVDVDNFKVYNDRYGHQRGDDCLCAVARAIVKVLERPGDVAARYGGEEFAVILPDTDAFAMIMVAERIRNAVMALGLEHACHSGGVVTISAGCANRCDAAAPEGPRAMIEAADRQLYAAKTAGRNRVLPQMKPGCHAVQARGLEIGAAAS
jgi:diguanylate cyclase (GGDEF)-like protein/PAS domain S-box-containing protein